MHGYEYEPGRLHHSEELVVDVKTAFPDAKLDLGQGKEVSVCSNHVFFLVCYEGFVSWECLDSQTILNLI